MTYTQRPTRPGRPRRAARHHTPAGSTAAGSRAQQLDALLPKLLLAAARLCASRRLPIAPLDLVESVALQVLNTSDQPICLSALIARLEAEINGYDDRRRHDVKTT